MALALDPLLIESLPCRLLARFHACWSQPPLLGYDNGSGANPTASKGIPLTKQGSDRSSFRSPSPSPKELKEGILQGQQLKEEIRVASVYLDEALQSPIRLQFGSFRGGLEGGQASAFTLSLVIMISWRRSGLDRE